MGPMEEFVNRAVELGRERGAQTARASLENLTEPIEWGQIVAWDSEDWPDEIGAVGDWLSGEWVDEDSTVTLLPRIGFMNYDVESAQDEWAANMIFQEYESAADEAYEATIKAYATLRLADWCYLVTYDGRQMAEHEARQMFDDYLDNMYGYIDVAGHSGNATSKLLKAADNAAYEQDFSAYVDALIKIDGWKEGRAF